MSHHPARAVGSYDSCPPAWGTPKIYVNPIQVQDLLGYPVACTGDLPIIFSFTSLQVKGACEMYSLSKLFKTLSAAMPSTKVKILKMSKQATTKQFLDNLS